MKIIQYMSVMLLVTMLTAACEKDNYTPPKSMLTGHVVYQDQPVGVRSNGVQLELWQHGYAFFSKIPVYIAQDGSFSARLFDGEYLLTLQNGVGPWVNNTDSITVTVKGNTVVDVPVEPYYLIKDAVYQKDGATINSTVNVESVNTTKALEAVKLYVFRTTLVDEQNQDASTTIEAASITDINQPLNISVTIPASLANADAVYVRVGVKTVGVEELAYSAPQKIQLK